MKIILKNRYSRYLEQAQLLEKDRKFETAKILYKKCIEINPNDDFSLERIKKIDDINNYSYCICDEETLCPRYGMNMDGELINHYWCQSTSQKEREIFLNQKNPRFFTSYYLENSECLFANIYQRKKEKIINELKNNIIKSKKYTNFDNVKILSLGHSDKQFTTIKDRDYIVKIDLNKIDAGKYSGNEWSESRAFASKKNMFPNDADIIGFTSASWNLKFDNRIDNFHNWGDAHILLNSRPEDNIVLCAHMHCSCLWSSNHSFLYTIYPRDYVKSIIRSFYRFMGFQDKKHIYVPYANQMIAHRKVIEEYLDFLRINLIFDKVEKFVNTINVPFIQDFKNKKYHNVRLNGYFMEMVTCLWFNSKDYIYLPQHNTGLHKWYANSFIEERSKTWL
jgi:hypothetical protein